MACDWGEIFNSKEFSIRLFIEHVIYDTPVLGAFENYKTYALEHENRITKASLVKELKLTQLFHNAFFKPDDNCIESHMYFDEVQIGLGKLIEKVATSIFPIIHEREHFLFFTDIDLTYAPRELGEALLTFHNNNLFTAPPSFLAYVGQLTDAQDVSKCETSNSEMPQGRYVDVPVLLKRWDVLPFELVGIATSHNVKLVNVRGASFDTSQLNHMLNENDESYMHDRILDLLILRSEAIRLEQEAKLLKIEEPPTPQGQAVVSNVSAEAQPTPPHTPDNVDQDDKPVHPKRKKTYLRLIYGLLKANSIPTELDQLAKEGMTLRDIQIILERAGTSLDEDTIKTIFEELKEKRNIIISR